jgi:hypothetical protein
VKAIPKTAGGDDVYFKKNTAYLYSQGASDPNSTWFQPTYKARTIEEGLATWNYKAGKAPAVKQRAEAVWLPWQANLEANQSLRCSLSLYWFPAADTTVSLAIGKRVLEELDKRRPVMTASIEGTAKAKLELAFAHLVASGKAEASLLWAAKMLANTVVGTGTPLMILGDLNIDASKATTPAGWGQAASGESTWGNTSGSQSELDWATFTRGVSTTIPEALLRYETGPKLNGVPIGMSDHSMMKYELTV